MDQEDGARQMLPLLTSVGVVCHSRPQIDALEEIKHLIESFADVSPLWTMPKACKRNVPGLLRLLRRVEAHQDPDMDSIYKHALIESTLVSAVQLGNTPVVHWAAEKDFSPGSKIRIRSGVEAAIRAGRLDLLEWFQANHRARAVWEARDLRDAAKAGRFELVRWLHANAIAAKFEDERKILREAVKNGDVAMAKWVCRLHLSSQEPEVLARQTAERVQALAPAFESTSRTSFDHDRPLLDEAIACGQAEMAKWLLTHGVIDATSLPSLRQASKAGHFEMLVWAARTLVMNDKVAIAIAVDEAAARGRIDIVEDLLQEHDDACTKKTMDQAAKNGHLDMVKWLHKNRSEGCSVAAMDGAASSGHLAVVQWLHENRSEGCTTRAMDQAARYGHLDVVRWLHEHRTEGCTPTAMDEAAAAVHLHVVRWLHEHREEGCSTHAMDAAARSRHLYRFSDSVPGLGPIDQNVATEESERLEVIKYLHSNRREGCTTDAMDHAARCGFLAIVRWLHANRSEGCTTAAMDGASACGILAVVTWFNENRSEGCSDKALNNAVRAGCLGVAQYLHTVCGKAVTERMLLLSASAGHTTVLKWLLWCYKEVPIGSDVMYEATSRGGLEVAMVLRDDGRCGVGLDAYLDAITTRRYTTFLWLLNQGSLQISDVMSQLDEESLWDRHLHACLDEFQRLM